MLNIKNERKIVKKIKNQLIRITNYLENNNNCNFNTNGEEKFVNDFFQFIEIYELLEKEDSKYLKLNRNILRRENIIPIWKILLMLIILQYQKNFWEN